MIRIIDRLRLRRRQIRRILMRRPEQRKIVLHLGVHKTGTTTIQRTLQVSRSRLPINTEVVPRTNKRLAEMAAITNDIRNVADAEAASTALELLATQLAGNFSMVERLLISHEDLLGVLPGKGDIKGLYPFAETFLPPLISGLQKMGASVEVVIYVRDFKDWQRSIFRHLNRADPTRRYAPRKFAERHDLPGNWSVFRSQIATALSSVPVHFVQFEDDRSTGTLGTALYRYLGLSVEERSRLHSLPAQNVSIEDAADLGIEKQPQT